MWGLFYKIDNFNANISNWDTSRVTDMNSMFRVHVARALCSDSSRPFPSTLHARPLHAPSTSPPPIPAWRPARIVCPPSDSWQQARSFNQPLSFNTSSVTDMQKMFKVHSACALCTHTVVEPFPARCIHAACAVTAPPTSPHRIISFRIDRAGPVTTAFSTSHYCSTRPASLTCSRCSRCIPLVPCAQAPVEPSLELCTLHARPPPHRDLPASRLAPCPTSFVCPPFDLAGRRQLQPAAELRHVQRQENGTNVQGENSARASFAQTPVEPSRARWHAAPHQPPRTASFLLDSWQGASAFNQSINFDMSSVTDMARMFEVCSYALPHPSSCVSRPKPRNPSGSMGLVRRQQALHLLCVV